MVPVSPARNAQSRPWWKVGSLGFLLFSIISYRDFRSKYDITVSSLSSAWFLIWYMIYIMQPRSYAKTRNSVRKSLCLPDGGQLQAEKKFNSHICTWLDNTKHGLRTILPLKQKQPDILNRFFSVNIKKGISPKPIHSCMFIRLP